MGLSPDSADREYDKFVDDGSGNTAIRVLANALVASSSTFSDYKTNDVDDAGSGVTYVGALIPNSELWLITKIVDTSGDLSITYANVSNNPTVTTYSAAWTARLTLTYNSIGDLTFTGQPGSIPTSSNPLPVEVIGEAVIIDYPHYNIHVGKHYFYRDSVELNSAGTQVYLITTPDTTVSPHSMFNIDGSAVTQFDLYEDSDRNGSTLQTVYNNNRRSSNTATVTIHKGIAGGTTDGTLIMTYKSGSSTNQSRSGAGARSEEEIILKRNTKYLLRITSGTNNNLTNFGINWYEHS